MGGPVTAGPPPPRPSTARLTSPPIAARRDQPRPRLVTAVFWLWWLAALLAVLTALFALTRFETVHADLARVARESDPAATPETIERVADLSVLVIVCGGALLGVGGGLFALGLRAGRRWARLTLAALTLLVVGYAVLVLSATGWLVLVYLAVAAVAAVCMYLPGVSRWLD